MRCVAAALVLCVALVGAACGGPAVESIGRPGTGDGEFLDPRGLAVSEHGLAVLDRSGRLQVFDLEGRFRSGFRVVTGDVRRGLPTGVLWLAGGDLAVAHTHESRVVVFGPDGAERRTFGEYGVAPGQFLYPQRLALDRDGDFVVSEYGFDRTNRVQIVRPDGTPVRVLGGGTAADGGLGRPMAALPFADGTVLVADAFAGLVLFGADGVSRGRFGPVVPEGVLPRGVCRAGGRGAEGDAGDIYVVVGGARQELWRLAPDGRLRGVFGAHGDAPLGFREPWDVAWWDGRVYVADMGNHRVARIDPEAVTWRTP